jgi:HEAT repeat protein
MASPTRHVMRMIAQDLESVGVHVKDHTYLIETNVPYPSAIPVLIRWIDQLRTVDLSDDDREYLWETLARALTVRQARPAAGPALVVLFREESLAEVTRWTVGNALDTVADPSLLDEMLAIAADRRYGMARQMVVHALGRVGQGQRREEVVDLLIELLDDDTVVAHAIIALTKLRAARAVDAIARHVDSEIPIARKSARTAVAKLGTRPTDVTPGQA